MREFCKGSILFFLLVGFLLGFYRIRQLELLSTFWKRTREGMDEAAGKRLLDKRKDLLSLQRSHNLWYRMEQVLNYSGWKRRFPFLTAEAWLFGNVVILSGVFVLLLVAGIGTMAFVICPFLLVAEYLLLRISMAKENNSVNQNLLKLLNFLGNYSITAGEVTGIFNQISKYVDEPIKSALNECCYEAQATGDAGMALFVMADKIEHPKFKELVYNLEISIRYCADYKALVDGSRRSVREYLRMCEEKKGILREAFINMLVLVGMSLFALLTVDGLVEQSVWSVLCDTFIGRSAILLVVGIFLLFFGQLMKDG